MRHLPLIQPPIIVRSRIRQGSAWFFSDDFDTFASDGCSILNISLAEQ